ncbi:unnamed protein product [Cuscuta europaea]|uniref:Uncharacterized protein n=1 Tax=Cuscuta europaea TaxID=41803 RepID=A0A9P1E086_CUSEU|nr:unnamed protein product [Cuscuta europaea]
MASSARCRLEQASVKRQIPCSPAPGLCEASTSLSSLFSGLCEASMPIQPETPIHRSLGNFVGSPMSSIDANSTRDTNSPIARSKYELQELLKLSLRISSQSKKQYLQADGFQSSSSIQKSEGLVEFIGILWIKVTKGTKLAVRDMLSREAESTNYIDEDHYIDEDQFKSNLE